MYVCVVCTHVWCVWVCVCVCVRTYVRTCMRVCMRIACTCVKSVELVYTVSNFLPLFISLDQSYVIDQAR